MVTGVWSRKTTHDLPLVPITVVSDRPQKCRVEILTECIWNQTIRFKSAVNIKFTKSTENNYAHANSVWKTDVCVQHFTDFCNILQLKGLIMNF